VQAGIWFKNNPKLGAKEKEVFHFLEICMGRLLKSNGKFVGIVMP